MLARVEKFAHLTLTLPPPLNLPPGDSWLVESASPSKFEWGPAA